MNHRLEFWCSLLFNSFWERENVAAGGVTHQSHHLMYIHYDDKSLAAFEAWLEVFTFPSLNYFRIGKKRHFFLLIINIDVVLMMEFDEAWKTVFFFKWQLRAVALTIKKNFFTLKHLKTLFISKLGKGNKKNTCVGVVEMLENWKKCHKIK